MNYRLVGAATVAAAVSLFAATPSLAQGNTKPGLYMQLTGGVSFLGKSELKASETGAGFSNSGSVDADLKSSFFASASVGTSMPTGLAVEVEGLYVKSDYDSGDIAKLFGPGLDAEVEGKGVMLNAIYALAPVGPAVFHVGAGAGYGQTKYSIEGDSVESTGLMWQAMTGLSFHATPTTSYDLTYRYLQLNREKASLTSAGYSASASAGTAVNVVSVGARFKF